MTNKYLSSLFKSYQKGDAREESYYEHLADFVRDFSQAKREELSSSIYKDDYDQMVKNYFIEMKDRGHVLPSLGLMRMVEAEESQSNKAGEMERGSNTADSYFVASGKSRRGKKLDPVERAKLAGGGLSAAKNGNFEKEIKSSSLSSATDLAVSSDSKQVLVVSGSLVYQIDLTTN